MKARKNIYRRGDRWYGRFKDARGRWRAKALSRHLDVAEKMLAELERDADLERGGLGGPVLQRRPIAEISREYLKHLKLRTTAGHVVQVTKSLDVVTTLLGARVVSQVTNDGLAAVQQRLATQGLSNRTVNIRVNHFVWMLKWAEDSGMIARMPRVRIDALPERGRHRRRQRLRMSIETVHKLITAARRRDARAHGLRQAPYLEVLAATGFRPGEALSLVWGDLRKESGGPNAGYWISVPGSRTKTGRGRANPIPKGLAENLLQLRGEQGAVIGHLPRDDEHMILAPQGKPWTVNSYRNLRRILAIVAKMAGVERKDASGRVLDYYAFRHSYCTILQERGIGMALVAELMGHKLPGMTLEVYTQADRLPKRDVVPILEAMLYGTPNDKQIVSQS